MNVIQLLENDHVWLKKNLGELEETTEHAVKTRPELFARIKRELTSHEKIEEEILYPALREHPRAKEELIDKVLEAYQEHHVADLLVAELTTLPPDDEMYGAKVKVLLESLEHHIEEEEDDIFVKMRKMFTPEQLEDLGERMAARKKEALAELAA